MTLVEEINQRLPFTLDGVFYNAALRHSLELRIDEEFDGKCEQVILDHLLLHAGFQNNLDSDSVLDRGRLLISAMGEGFPYWVVMVGEAFVSQLATMGRKLSVYEDWVEWDV